MDAVIACHSGLSPRSAPRQVGHLPCAGCGRRTELRADRGTQPVPRAMDLGDIGQQRHDRMTVAAVQSSCGLVGEDRRRVADHGTRDRNALLFAGTELTRKCIDLVAEANSVQRIYRLGVSIQGPCTRHFERQPDILDRSERRKQMIGLKDEATCRRRISASCSGRSSAVVCPRIRTVPLVGVSMQPSTKRSVVLPLPDGPINRTNSPPASERLTPRNAATRPAPVPRYFTTSVASIKVWVITPEPSYGQRDRAGRGAITRRSGVN